MCDCMEGNKEGVIVFGGERGCVVVGGIEGV